MESLISVCIPTHNRSGLLRDCVASIRNAGYPLLRMELLIFDDASAAEEAAEIRRIVAGVQAEFNRVQLLRSELNVKVLAARKALAESSDPQAEYLLFMDDDGELRPGTLRVLADFMAGHAEAGAAGPRMVSPAGEFLHGANFIHPWTGRYSASDAARSIPCDWLNTTCVLLRREALIAAGGVDASFEQSHGEADLCLRMKRNGFEMFYVPAASVVHRIEPNTVRRERLYHLYRNKFWVIRKHFHGFRKFSALAVHLILGTPRYLCESFRANGGWKAAESKLIVKAVWDGLWREISK